MNEHEKSGLYHSDRLKSPFCGERLGFALFFQGFSRSDLFAMRKQQEGIVPEYEFLPPTIAIWAVLCLILRELNSSPIWKSGDIHSIQSSVTHPR